VCSAARSALASRIYNPELEILIKLVLRWLLMIFMSAGTLLYSATRVSADRRNLQQKGGQISCSTVQQLIDDGRFDCVNEQARGQCPDLLCGQQTNGSITTSDDTRPPSDGLPSHGASSW
jgi:hypothetical protein